MVIVVSDAIEPWFKYIWEQFAQINSLNTEYKLITYSDYMVAGRSKSEALLIEYGTRQRYPESLFIPRKKEFKTDDYVWIREDLPVYRSTISESKDYDVFFNAFVHLSRLEEWESEKNGRYIHSYSFRHPRKKKKIWKIPVVNYLFNELEKKIRTKYPGVSFGNKLKPIIEFSHDVDYIEKTLQLRFKQPLFYFINSVKSLSNLNCIESLFKLKDGVGFTLKKNNYWFFDKWQEIEDEAGVKSVFYFFVKTDIRRKKDRIKSWLLNPSYDIKRDKRLMKKIRDLVKKGWEIGLHGSINSYKEPELLKKELMLLEDIAESRITRVRQHWLKYQEQVTTRIHQEIGFKKDSTLGFNDEIGFRAGVASVYNPYDHRNQKEFGITEVPLVVMDFSLYDYSNQTYVASLEKNYSLKYLLRNINVLDSFYFSVDWHQRTLAKDYNFELPYNIFKY